MHGDPVPFHAVEDMSGNDNRVIADYKKAFENEYASLYRFLKASRGTRPIEK